jgi:hypothetical protein
VLGMVPVIYLTAKAFPAMEPRASANKNATRKPLMTVVAVRGATVRSSVIVAVRTSRREADADADLSLYSGSRHHEANCSNRS